MLMGPMVLCVTTLGTIRVPLLSADNWDSLNMVKRQKNAMRLVKHYISNECCVHTMSFE